jgi:hypothetical protein
VIAARLSASGRVNRFRVGIGLCKTIRRIPVSPPLDKAEHMFYIASMLAGPRRTLLRRPLPRPTARPDRDGLLRGVQHLLPPGPPPRRGVPAESLTGLSPVTIRCHATRPDAPRLSRPPKSMGDPCQKSTVPTISPTPNPNIPLRVLPHPRREGGRGLGSPRVPHPASRPPSAPFPRQLVSFAAVPARVRIARCTTLR